MNPLSQFIGGPKPGAQTGHEGHPAKASARHALSALLRQHAIDPTQIDASLFEELELSAYGCVLARRAGRAPGSAEIHRYMEALANNFPLRGVLLQAAAALRAAGVRAIVYKGQDYLERLYGELGARPMADVDLLVPEAELGAAEQALLAAGFLADRACKLMHERKFCKDGVALDLHHALLQPARMAIDHEQLFERAEPCTFAPGLLVLERTDALLVHCINQTVKGYHLPPSSYLELQLLLQQADAEAALRRAGLWRARSALYTSLRTLGELGNPTAQALSARVQLSGRRRAVLDGVMVRFALASLLREQPSRATMLALKTTLIDDAAAIARFVPQWCSWQMPFKPARPLACEPSIPRAPPGASNSVWSSRRPTC